MCHVYSDIDSVESAGTAGGDRRLEGECTYLALLNLAFNGGDPRAISSRSRASLRRIGRINLYRPERRRSDSCHGSHAELSSGHDRPLRHAHIHPTILVTISGSHSGCGLCGQRSGRLSFGGERDHHVQADASSVHVRTSQGSSNVSPHRRI